MKKAIALLLIILMLPLNVNAAMAYELDYTNIDYSFHITRDKSYPGSYQQDEKCGYVVTFAPKIIEVKRGPTTTKVTAEVTDSARVVMIQWKDGNEWHTKPYSNQWCFGPVIARTSSQIKLKQDGNYSSWTQITVTQGKDVLYKAKKYHPNDLQAGYAVGIDNKLVNYLRNEVSRQRTYNIPCHASVIRMRLVYTGFKGNSYSRWVEVKVR